MKALKIIKWIVLGALFIALVPYVVMLLWNWLMPELFGVPAITWLQSLGLLLLSKILFGFGGGGKCKCHKDRKHWKHKMYHQFSRMSDEERAALKKKMKEKWCKPKDDDASQSLANTSGN